MSIRRAFKWGFLFAIALVILATVAVLTADFGFLRGTVEKQLRLATGRSVSIEGTLSIHLGSIIAVEAHDVRLANPDWANEPEMLELDRVRFEVQAASLWDGPPLVRQLDVDGLTLNLEQDETGGASWQFGHATAPSPAGQAGPPLLLQHARIARGRVHLQTPRLDSPLNLELEKAEQWLDMEGQVRLSLAGLVNGKGLALEGVLGPWDHLISGDDVRIDVTGKLGQAEGAAKGQIDRLWAPRQPELNLVVSAPSLQQAMETLGISGLGDGSVSIDLSTARTVEGSLLVHADIRLGELLLNLKGGMRGLDDTQDLSLDLKASGPNFGRLAGLAGFEGWPNESFTVAALLRRPNDGLEIKQLELSLAGTNVDLEGTVPEFPELRGAEITLQISGSNLAAFSGATGLSMLSPGAFSIDGTVATPSADHTTFDLRLSLPLGGGRVDGTLFKDQSLELDLDLAGTDLAQLSGLAGVGALPAGPWKLAGQMTTAGDADFDFQLETPVGKGRASGRFHDASDFDLDLSLGGQNAQRTANLFEMPWLPAKPWQLDLSASQSNPDVLNLALFIFKTEGLQLNASGSVGAEPLQSGTDLGFTLEGSRLASFQEFAPQTLTLPAVEFGATGRISVHDNALQLAPVNLQIGTNHYSLNGAINLDESRTGTRVSLKAEGQDIGRLFDLPGAARLPEGPFTSQGVVAVAANELEIEQFKLSAGSLEMAVDAAVPWPLDLAQGRFSIVSSGGDVSQVLPELLDVQFDSTSFDLNFTGQWDEDRIEFSRGQLRIGSSTLGVLGAIDLPPNVSTTDLTVTANSPDLSRLGTVDGKRWGTVPFDLETRLSGNAKSVELSRLRLRLGEADISGIFKVNLGPATPEVDLRLSTNVLNLRPFLGEEQAGPPPDAKPNPDGRLIPDMMLPLGLLKRINGNFAIAADRLLLRRSTLVNALISGSLREGNLRVNEFGTDTYGGRLAATLALEPLANEVEAKLSIGIHSKGLILDFSDTPDQAKRALPPVDVDIDLEGIGKTIREVAASLNGKLIMSSPGGVIANPAGLDQRSPFLIQIISAISPLTFKQPQLEIVCLAAVGNIRQGKVLLDPGLALQSSRINLLTFGTIDLETEKLDVHFNAHTRRAVDITAGDILSPYVMLSGTLANPKIGVDPKSTLIRGGAAILSGGLSILAKKALEQREGTGDACARILEQGEANESKP